MLVAPTPVEVEEAAEEEVEEAGSSSKITGAGAGCWAGLRCCKLVLLP